MEKKKVFEKIAETLEKEIAALDSGAASAHQMSVDAPSAMQSHSDTTKFQMKAIEENTKKAILGKQVSLAALKKMLSDLPESLDEVVLGALVRIAEGEDIKNYALFEGGAGIAVEENGARWIVVTPSSPLGAALMGKRKGDIFSFSAGSKDRELKLVDLI